MYALPWMSNTRKGSMYFGSSLLLPTLVTACLGKFTVYSSTRPLLLDEKTLALSL